VSEEKAPPANWQGDYPKPYYSVTAYNDPINLEAVKRAYLPWYFRWGMAIVDALKAGYRRIMRRH
jgi:hypothetical protein